MSILMMIPLNMMMMMKTSNSPMLILILLLMMVWLFSIVFLMSGVNIWSMLYLVFLFNGGLMIVYLFVVAFLPKEKKSFSNKVFLLTIFLVIMISSFWLSGDSFFESSYTLTLWVLLSLVFIISIFTFFIFILMMDPFKTMKSSF